MLPKVTQYQVGLSAALTINSSEKTGMMIIYIEYIYGYDNFIPVFKKKVR